MMLQKPPILSMTVADCGDHQMDNTPLLQVRDLSVCFNGHAVVDKISYTLHRGETLGIVGESGSGKSVSSLALMGLLPDNASISGSAMLGGEELLGLTETQFRKVRGKRVSMIFQEPMTSLNPVHRCGVQVVEMLQLHEDVCDDEARKRVLQLFEEVRLPRPEQIFDSYPHEISGGQKQRVMIAMALVCHPEVVIADEPTTALDVTVQKTILELLRELQRTRNLSVIFISHDLGVIAQIADNIVVMYQGKVVEQGTSNEILHNPQVPYTQGLLACRPPLDSRPRRLPTVADYIGEVKKNGTDEPQAFVGNPPNVTEKKPLLTVSHLSVTYALEKNLLGKVKKELQAVDDISFEVYKGETMGLVGESGCGKTTLGRAILRLVESASGSIFFDGKRLDTLSKNELRRIRSRIQIIFQDPYSSLNPRMTVGQTLMEPLASHGMGGDRKQQNQKVLDLMERVGLKHEWFNRYPHEFSGGQRQRICIARALVLDPELVICDESVSALDVSVQAQVLNLLNELKEQFGYTYIFISHDLSVVHFISDRIMVMQSGKLVELGDSDSLFSSPQALYTRKLLDAIPRIE